MELTRDAEAKGLLQPLTTETGHAAVDTVGLILRMLGEYAFDLGAIQASTTREQCDRWARHILVGAPHPHRGPQPGQPTERDWGGLRAFVTDLRRQEHAYVTKNVRDMRTALSSFVATVGKTLGEDREAQGRILALLDDMQQTMTSASLETLKQEVAVATNVIRDIIEQREKHHSALMAQMQERLSAMGDELTEVRHEMELDPLTRLYNRNAFDQELQRTVRTSQLTGRGACLLMVDVDHFKEVNDAYGHPTGDQVLKDLADCCLRVFPRRSDFVARYGGEEFAIILQETPLDAARMLSDRLLKAVRTLRLDSLEADWRLTVSVGIAEFGPRDSAGSWVRNADAALYRAKHTGRDRVEVHEGD